MDYTVKEFNRDNRCPRKALPDSTVSSLNNTDVLNLNTFILNSQSNVLWIAPSFSRNSITDSHESSKRKKPRQCWTFFFCCSVGRDRTYDQAITFILKLLEGMDYIIILSDARRFRFTFSKQYSSEG